jgi:hypothetical protein
MMLYFCPIGSSQIGFGAADSTIVFKLFEQVSLVVPWESPDLDFGNSMIFFSLIY